MIKVAMTLDICAFLYTMLLMIVYYSKKRVKSFETSLFGFLIFVALFGILTEFTQSLLSSIDTTKYMILIRICAKFYLLTYYIMTLYLIAYIILKLYDSKEQDKIIKLKNKLLITFGIISAIMTLIATIFQGDIVTDGESYYGTGIGVVFIVINSVILGITSIIALIKNHKKDNSKGNILYVSIAIFLTISGILRLLLPELMINNLFNTFIIAIMFFTIENPDINLITDLKKANAAKDKFLSSMSHEMRTPLNGIIGLSSLSEEEDMKDINKEANKLLDIVDNVIEFNSINKNQILEYKEKFNIESILYPIIENNRNILSETQIEFYSNIESKEITSNPEAIKSIVSKILSNSIKYTKEGYIKLDINTNNNKLIISLKDTGIGIKKENLDNIYNTFSREEENVDGTISGLGLGLSIVKQNIDALKGTITINSIENQGTDITIEIPIEIV